MKRSIVKPALLAVTLLLLAACSGSQEKSEPEGYFATHTTEDGEKLFQYTLDIQGSEYGQRGRSKGGKPVGGYVAGSSGRGINGGLTMGTRTGKRPQGGGGKGGPGEFSEIQTLLDQGLEEELKKAGYCSEGYQVTERSTGPTDYFIKGKCLPAA